MGVVGLHEGLTLIVGMRASLWCRPVAGCDLSPEKRSVAEEECPGLWTTDDYDAMLARPDLDIVAIYTPDALHADQILAAFRAGKHVICTKPLINDPRRAQELLEAAANHGVRLQVGQSTRFYETFQRQRADFEEGKVGAVEVVDAHYNHRMDWYYEKSPWTVTDTHWCYLGLSHPIDLVRWYLGRIREVHAVGTISTLGKRYGISKPDAIAVQMMAESGAIGRAFGHYGMHELSKARSLIECLLMGDAGTSLARYPDLKYTYLASDGAEVDADFDHAMAGYYYRHELKGMHFGEFCNYLDYFAWKLATGEPNSPDLREGLETVMVMRAVERSLETGRVETVESLP